MKNKVAIILLTVALLTAGVVYIVFFKPGGQKTSNAVQQQSISLEDQLKKACEVLSDETAKTILGGDAVKVEQGSDATSSSDKIAVSQCAYSEKPQQANAANLKSVNLLSRIARNDEGRKANEQIFSDTMRPEQTEVIQGYGEKAFWNVQYGQLNVLKAGNWYIIEFGLAAPSDRLLTDTKVVADIIVPRL